MGEHLIVTRIFLCACCRRYSTKERDKTRWKHAVDEHITND